MQKEVFWCSSCLNMSTRPRISFDEKGQCNACTWSKEKKSFEEGMRVRRNEVQVLEKRLLQKEENLEKKVDSMISEIFVT